MVVGCKIDGIYKIVNEIIIRVFGEVPRDCCFTCIMTGTTPFVWDLILKKHLKVHGYAQGKLSLPVVLLGILCF